MRGTDNRKDQRQQTNDELNDLIKIFKEEKLKSITDKLVQQENISLLDALKIVAKTVYFTTYFHPRH